MVDEPSTGDLTASASQHADAHLISKHALGLKSLYAAKAGAMVTRSTKRQMPAELLSGRPHTHNALDDAIEQAELFHNLIRWSGASSRADASSAQGTPPRE